MSHAMERRRHEPAKLKMQSRFRKPHAARNGAIIIYAVVVLPVIVGFASLAVDLGHVAVVKEEMRRAAMACAQAGAWGSASGQASSYAQAVIGDNTSDGVALTTTNLTVTTGYWSSTNGWSSWNTGGLPAAVKCTVSRTAASHTAVSLSFAGIFGMKSLDVSASCTAVYLPTTSVTNVTVGGTNDPYLSGEPYGTNASGDDYAGGINGTVNCQPQPISNVHVVPGQTLQLSNTSGTVAHDPTDALMSALGDTTYILDHDAGAQNGFSDITAPIDSLIAVFYNENSTPDQIATVPPALDFTSQTSRDYTTISPMLQQVFYVGTGKNSSNQQQSIVVPPGATTMVLAVMDGFEWMNNRGSFKTTVTSQPAVVIVQ